MELSETIVSLSIKNTDYVATITLVNILKRIIMNYKELGTVNIQDIEDSSIVLGENEYLLKVDGQMGFMVKLNKDGSIPKAFKDWCRYGSANLSEQVYLIDEEFRSGWTFKDLRTGMSTAWLQIKHPLGFILEINGKAFSKICSTISMDNGIITTPCRFIPALKNATLEVLAC